MTEKERIKQVIKDQLKLCGPDPEKDRWWVTFTADDARRILEYLGNEDAEKNPAEQIMNYLKMAYVGAHAFDDIETMTRIARAMESFEQPVIEKE